MRKLNSEGFSAVEALLIVLILGILGGAGYYVFNAQKEAKKALDNTSNSQNELQKTEAVTESKPAEKTNVHEDETGRWLLYETPNKESSMRIADGWKLMWQTEYTNLTAYGDIDYEPGTKAVVEETQGGRGGPFTFMLILTDKEVTDRGTLKGEFKTSSGLTGQKYEFVQDEENQGHDLQKGEKEYTYYFNKNGKYIRVIHSVFSPYNDNVELVEKALKTLVIN